MELGESAPSTLELIKSQEWTILNPQDPRARLPALFFASENLIQQFGINSVLSPNELRYLAELEVSLGTLNQAQLKNYHLTKLINPEHHYVYLVGQDDVLSEEFSSDYSHIFLTLDQTGFFPDGSVISLVKFPPVEIPDSLKSLPESMQGIAARRLLLTSVSMPIWECPDMYWGKFGAQALALDMTYHSLGVNRAPAGIFIDGFSIEAIRE
ncbi:hypothetical protein GF357_01450 [Candidatus Dojkabacteria bacterium]|nr:hypothetical protein [Candidatus Dojkabacteria bacterium]